MTDEPFDEASAQDFLDSLPEPDGLIDDIVEDSRFAAAQRIDPNLARIAELRLRLAGPRVVDGFYDPDVEEALAGPLGREFAAAGDPTMPQMRLGLVGVSAGSVVLHYRPAIPTLADSGEQIGVPIVPADAAVRRVLRLHGLFESGAAPEEVAAFAADNTALLKGARGVVEALVKFELDLSATWWSPLGDSVRSTLTQRGRDHAAAIFRREDRDEPEQIWGLVSALDVDGFVTVRRQSQRFRIRVDENQVSEFTLGENVHLLVTSTNHVDRVGLRGRVEYRYVRRLEITDYLDFDPPN